MNKLTEGEAVVGSLYSENGIKVAGFEYGKIKIGNKTGDAIAAGSLVYITGYDATLGCPTVTLADANGTNAYAELVVPVAIANDAAGYGYERYELTGLNTSGASAVGSPVYLSETVGGWTVTAPTGASSDVQKIGWVTAKHASTGKILVMLGRQSMVSYCLNGLQSKTVNAGRIADGAVTGVKLADDCIKFAVVDGTNTAVNVTVSGMIATDVIIFVGAFATKASIATFADRTAEYVAGAGVATKAAGTNETNNQLIIIYIHKVP